MSDKSEGQWEAGRAGIRNPFNPPPEKDMRERLQDIVGIPAEDLTRRGPMKDKLDESVARDTAELVRQEKVADADATPATYAGEKLKEGAEAIKTGVNRLAESLHLKDAPQKSG